MENGYPVKHENTYNSDLSSVMKCVMISFVAGKAFEDFLHGISRRVGMADEADSKSVVGNHVRVQVPLPALVKIVGIPVKIMVLTIFLLLKFDNS